VGAKTLAEFTGHAISSWRDLATLDNASYAGAAPLDSDEIYQAQLPTYA
jgi:hypothetical protein